MKMLALSALTVTVLLASPCAAAPSSAAYWDMSLKSAERLFPDATLTRSPGSSTRSLTLHDIDYGGVRWREVRLSFDSHSRLERAVVVTDSARFEDLRERVLSNFDQFSPVLIDAVDKGAGDGDVIICEDEFAHVSLTYVRPAAPSTLRYARRNTDLDESRG